MNRKRAAELLPVIKAFAEGRQIEMRRDSSERWQSYLSYSFDNNVEYRIKPVPREWSVCPDVDGTALWVRGKNSAISENEWVRVREVLDE